MMTRRMRKQMETFLLSLHVNLNMVVVLSLFFVSYFSSSAIAYNRYSQGLSKWSFQGSSDSHELYSDLLCPNPMFQSAKPSWNEYTFQAQNVSSVTLVSHDNAPIPHDVWSIKTNTEINFLPCDLRPVENNNTWKNPFRVARKRLLVKFNVSFESFPFNQASRQCTTFMKLKLDEENGMEMRCDRKNSFALQSGNYISWPQANNERTSSFSLFRNLEGFLLNETSFRFRFFFHLYLMTWDDGGQRRCIVQQYELNLRDRQCTPKRKYIGTVCGEYNCNSEPVFRNFIYNQRKFARNWNENKHIPRPKEVNVFKPNSNVRFILFLTFLAVLLLGILVFGMQITISIGCRKRSVNKDQETDERSQQILQNSLNVWESFETRDQPRSVKFSPVAASVNTHATMEGQGSLENPKILKSAMKRKAEMAAAAQGSSRGYHMDYHGEQPPAYIDTMHD